MVTHEFVTRLAKHVMSPANPNQRDSPLLSEIFEEFLVATAESDLTDEQLQTWFREITEDLRSRHTGFRGPWEYITRLVTNHINLQLSTSKVILYTLIPVSGLLVSLNYVQRWRITPRAVLRRIDPREIPDFAFEFQRMHTEDFPSVGLLYRCTIPVPDVQAQYNDDEYFRQVLEDAQNAATALQLLSTQGVHFPWLIHYVPGCQFANNIGKWNIAWFNQSSSQNPVHVYHAPEVRMGQRLVSDIAKLDADVRQRIEVALRRYHEAANKLNQTDRIVDYWIVVESLFGTGEGTNSRKMATRLVSYLFEQFSAKQRETVFTWVVKVWYGTRCLIVHGKLPSHDWYDAYQIATAAQELVRCTLLKFAVEKSDLKRIFAHADKISAKTSLPNAQELKELTIGNELHEEISSLILDCVDVIGGRLWKTEVD